jgi:hypothetical protein
LGDIQDDIKFLAGLNQASVNWGWYEEGFNSGTADIGGQSAYIEHHNAPQFFGYVAANPKINKNLHTYSQFFTDIGNANLGAGGVFYIKGGFKNQYGLVPLNAANNATPSEAGIGLPGEFSRPVASIARPRTIGRLAPGRSSSSSFKEGGKGGDCCPGTRLSVCRRDIIPKGVLG